MAGTAYTYDLNGNLTSDGTHTYTWNIKNQLSSSGSQTFSYGPSGSRYKTVDGTDTTIYVNSYLEVRPEGATYYIFNGSQRIASVKDSTLTYYSQDHLGGTALATNSTGTVVEVDDYYPYGSSLASIHAGTAPVHHTFTDKEFDDSLGLFYFEARWYNPTIGRFVSEDPMQYKGVNASRQGMALLADPQSLNFYSYTRDNPVNLSDPTGEFAWDTGKTAGGQWLTAAWNVVSTVSKALGAGACLPTNAAASGVLTAGAIADLDETFVHTTNALGNTINAFQDEGIQTFAEEGPYTQALESLPGAQAAMELGQKISDVLEWGKDTKGFINNINQETSKSDAGINAASETMKNIFYWTADTFDTTLDVSTDKGIIETAVDPSEKR